VRRSGRDTIVVLDTNVLISYLWSSANCIRIVRAMLLEDRFTAAVSHVMMEEFDNVLSRPKIKRRIGEIDPAIFRREYLLSTHMVQPKKTVTLCGDPNDNMLLECAEEARADFLVTGDDDLLCLGRFDKTQIVKPAWFIEHFLDG
jgi:putative PIN family toxin of toxin-antitoxin system